MQLNLNTQITNGLNAFTYNGNALSPLDSHPNIYMGLGLWSVKDGLSQDLPVNVTQMLIAAALMRLKTKESSPIPCKEVETTKEFGVALAKVDASPLMQLITKTDYPEDRRYVIQTETMQEIKAVSYVKKKTAAHWQEVAAVCNGLIQAKVAYPELLPVGCLQKNNVRGTVYRMLNHWVNAPVCLPAASIKHDIPEQITVERYHEDSLYQDDSTIAYKPRYVLL